MTLAGPLFYAIVRVGVGVGVGVANLPFHKPSRAFSLLEVAVSIAILSIILLSIFAMFTQGMHVLSHSKQVDFATERAQECLETVRAFGVGAVVAGTYDSRIGDMPVSGFPPYPYNPAPSDYPMVVEATTTGAPPGTIAVRADVYYQPDRKVSLETYFSL